MKTNLAAQYYFESDYFQRERDSLFAGTWQLLCPVSKLQIPGSYISEDIAGMKVIAIRGRDGELRAFRNVCRHRGAQLMERGDGQCKTIRCPYHNWTYSDNGELKTAPWFGEDADFNLSDWPLETVQIDSWRGLAFVCVEPRETLQEQLGVLNDELADIAMEQYHNTDSAKLQFTGNWKIYTDNFVEGYHIPGIHPAFFDAIDFEKFETTAHKGFVKMTAPAKQDLFYKGRWYWMWPNWTLSLFEGGMNTSRINPINENETELLYHFYFEENYQNDEAFRQDTIERNLAVIREDFTICLETHNNYRSGGYSSGPLSPRHEKGVVYFQDQYKAILNLSE